MIARDLEPKLMSWEWPVLCFNFMSGGVPYQRITKLNMPRMDGSWALTLIRNGKKYREFHFIHGCM